MIKHRLMLSAAAAALLTAGLTVLAARADVEISTSTSTPLSTSTSGNIVIDATGAVNISQSNVAAVTLNSSQSVTNNGSIANTGIDAGIGATIDTTSGNLVSNGFASTGGIDVGGNGTGKVGLLIEGGNTFYGPVSLTALTATALTGATAVTQASAMIVQGDGSAALLLVQGTRVTSNILLGGGGIVQNASTNSTNSGSIIVDLDGTVNGNVYQQGGISGVGPGIIGLQTAGGIHSCASDTGAPSGFTCPSSSGGSLVNAGTISLIGTRTFNTRGGNPEAGSAVVIGGNIDGGFDNYGPATASNASAAVISSSGVSSSVVMIDPTKSITGALSLPRGPVVLGPVTADIDAVDYGYSFINHGTISSQPVDADRSTAGVIIVGASPTYFTCLGTTAGSVSTTAANCATPTARTDNVISTVNGATVTRAVNYTALGGLLNTGTISSAAFTNSQTVTSNGVISATALYVGAYTVIPRIDVTAEPINASNNTPATIQAQVSGIGGGSASAIVLDQNSTVPVISVGQHASIVASVSTNTIAPTKAIAPTASQPFSLASEAIRDTWGSLKTINNAGTIQAVNTQLIPETGAFVSSITNAIDLSSGGASLGAPAPGNIVINNSGRILGDVLLNSAGNNDILNVGNTGANGAANGVTGISNTPDNYAVVAESIISQTSRLAPITTADVINFGSGNNHLLHVGGYGYVNAVISSGTGSLAVQVDANGQLFVANTTTPLSASTFNIAANGTLGLAISQSNLNNLSPVVQANSASLSGATLALQFGTYISSGFTAASTSNPSVQTVTLVRAASITDTTLSTQNALLGQNTPFLFETPAESSVTPLSISQENPTDPNSQQLLQLKLLPRSTGAKNADGSPGLNLSGDAKNQFPYTARALSTDDELGAAVATSMTVYNTPGLPGSGINVAASQQQAEQVFSQFAPDVSGGTREIAIMLTDQATGPVAARQRLLRSFGNVAGDTTLWGEEFTGQINNKGRVSAAGTLTAYKDHGFGFVLGADGGSPRNGWYGGAFTFYSGDVSQQLPRATRTNTQWYMLSGYTDWHGKHAFLDTDISAAYGDFSETRVLNAGGLVRTATSRRPGAMLALGANTGVMLKYSGFEIDPHISLDGMTMREEGYQEANGGPGFNLDVAPYFASSLRTAIGADFKTKITLWHFDLTPEARLGYRYDMLQDPVKIKAAFESTGGRAAAGNTLTFVGPDPDSGNAIAGLSLGASTDTWQLGVNYDWIRGNNGSTTQVGIITVLGRI
ncbi:MAG TPA: autotransporter domain-containing protein [Rhizomicrobium sp.]|nr:autotransporter domain-containing protein [Rhizomicrobium sp.]